MAPYKSDLMHILAERGYIHQCTDDSALDALAAAGSLGAYIGFDCTAPSLHVGSLLQIMMLRVLQKTGHRPIVLMGGGTTKIGDPSGKDDARKLLSAEDIANNLQGIRRVFDRFLRFDESPNGAVMANNADWLDGLAYIPFLRQFGRHFSVNRMLGFDSVRLRLERQQPLSFLEFNYMILQAYDFLELSRRHDCRVQLGGSDQWGNIVSGIDLARRIDGSALYGLVSPLITTASGAKMGKSASGAVWIDESRLSSYDYWQFWRNTEDGDVGRFLRLFTDLPLDEIARLEALGGEEINQAKKILADQATTLAHGAGAAARAAETARRTFEEGATGDALPSIDVPRTDLEAGVPAFALFRDSGLCASSGEARRLIKGGGARVNDKKLGATDATIGVADIDDKGLIKLSAGRKRHALLRIV